VNLKVRPESGRKCVQMLVAYGVRRDGRRELLTFMRSQGESQGAWEGLLNDLYCRGLRGKHLQLIITDGCPGLAGAIQTVYLRVLHQRCWVHKMRNIREKGRKRDRDVIFTVDQDDQEVTHITYVPTTADCRKVIKSHPAARRRFGIARESSLSSSAKRSIPDGMNL